VAAFSDVLNEVYTLTNRPELVAESTSAVKAATLKMHHAEFWPQDIYETQVNFGALDYQQQFQYKQAIPLFRTFKYARVIDPSGLASLYSPNLLGQPLDPINDGIKLLQFFTPIDPLNTLDQYKVDRKNTCYLAGAQINFRCQAQFQYILFGCYVNPNITTTGYSSWIADEHLYAIVFEAVRQVFAMIGYAEQATNYEKLVGEQIAELVRTKLPLAGE
jgi:hypothetical protein